MRWRVDGYGASAYGGGITRRSSHKKSLRIHAAMQVPGTGAGTGSPGSNLRWFYMAEFYACGATYMFTRIVVNLSQTYVPFLVLNTLRMEHYALASVPATMYVSALLGTLGQEAAQASVAVNSASSLSSFQKK